MLALYCTVSQQTAETVRHGKKPGVQHGDVQTIPAEEKMGTGRSLRRHREIPEHGQQTGLINRHCRLEHVNDEKKK